MKSTDSDGWFPIALGRDVLPLRICRSRIENVPLVVWRDEEDRIQVWIDRCPHRSIRLSAGRNFGSYIEGAYHGWRFGKDGSVLGVPAEGYAPRPDIRVQVLSSVLQDGLVFTSLSRKGSAPTSKVTLGRYDELIRPLPFRVEADVVERAIFGISGLRTLVTPTGARSCWVYGYISLGSRESVMDGLRRANAQLSDIRRKLEAGVSS